MPTLEEVRALCRVFPGVTEVVNGQGGGFSWRAAKGQFVWERRPRKSDLASLREQGLQWPEGTVIGLRTDGLDAKQALLQTAPGTFFTIAHFDGWPAVLSALDTADPELLREAITDSWLLRTSAALRRSWLAEHDLD